MYNQEMIEKFWSKTKPKNGCLIFGSGKPYGGFQKMKAYKFAYLITKGKIEKGMVIRHTCDNPACVNPEHLILGTASDNMNDMKLRGRLKETIGFSAINFSDFLTVNEAMALLWNNGIKRTSIWLRNNMMSGTFSSEKVGTSRVVYKQDILKFIRNQIKRGD